MQQQQSPSFLTAADELAVPMILYALHVSGAVPHATPAAASAPVTTAFASTAPATQPVSAVPKSFERRDFLRAIEAKMQAACVVVVA